MNPVRFAADNGVPEPEAIDLFLHAAHAGLVSMNWHLLCPFCGEVTESFSALKAVDSRYFCPP